MTKQTLKNSALALGLLGLALIPSTSVAQVGLASKLPGKNPATAAAQTASHQAKTPGSPSYTYTLLGFPGTLSTFAEGMNLGATTSKIEIVGGAGEGGFLASVSEKKTTTEKYEAVNYPHGPGPGDATAVNDSGQIVGLYCTTTQCISDTIGAQGFLLSQGVFTTITIPGEAFAFAAGINNNGVVLGVYQDTAGLVVSFLATP